MKITLLGTGTPTPNLDRASAGYMLEIGDDVILIDHGPGAHNRFLETGKKAVDVTHMFLTHYHYDHWVEYPRFFLQRWDQGGGIKPELKTYGPEPLLELHEKLFSRDGVYGLDLQARTERESSYAFYKARGGELDSRPWPNPDLHQLTSGDEVSGKGWRCKVQAVPHAGPMLKSLAYRFETDEGSLVVSGDTGISKVFTRFCEGADVLIYMCHYYSGTGYYGDEHPEVAGHMETAKTAAEAGVKMLVLTHLNVSIDIPGIREEIIQDIGKVFSGHLIWGEDLMEVPLDGPKRTIMR